ncbi:MAG: TlpA family protein disulfide reductase [Rhodocyclaceae bacterium]|nr:TlpA family protein disulfide reductase [Rhodocyclaceae bacterium]
MSKAVRHALLLIAVSTCAAMAGYFFGRPKTVPLPPPAIIPAIDAPARLLALTLPDLNGQPQSLAQWKGKVLVINFWATWCAPCREEMPEFSRISAKYALNGVQFVGISIDSADKVAEFQKEMQISYPLLIGNLDSLDLSGDLGNRAKALPFTVILRPDGSPQEIKLGKYATADLEKVILTALQPR